MFRSQDAARPASRWRLFRLRRVGRLLTVVRKSHTVWFRLGAVAKIRHIVSSLLATPLRKSTNGGLREFSRAPKIKNAGIMPKRSHPEVSFAQDIRTTERIYAARFN